LVQNAIVNGLSWGSNPLLMCITTAPAIEASAP